MVELKDIAVSYGEFEAIANLNLKIVKGEFFTFLGSSGCGKTTTLRTIAGFLTPSRGNVFINNRDVTRLRPEERRVGIVFQNYALFPHMTARQNIGFGLKVRRMKKSFISEKVEYYANIAGISEILDKSVAALSGGQQQRVAIARSLAIEPELLLLDEPLSNLDAKLRLSMRKELKRLQKDLGITTVYVTHDQEEALEISDRVAVFTVGKIEQVGTPQEIYRNPSNLSVCQFIGEINPLNHDLLQKITERESKFSYQKDKAYYIRKERIRLSGENQTDENKLCFPAEVIDNSYTGMIYKFIVSCFGSNMEVVQFDSPNLIYNIGDTITINFSIEDIQRF